MEATWVAARAGRVAEMNRLLGEDPGLLEAKYDNNETLLMRASCGARLSVVQWLLDKGAAINERDDSGSTALHHACLMGRPKVAILLMERGADPSIAGAGGSTPLDGPSHQRLPDVCGGAARPPQRRDLHQPPR
jgi:uncharacterized protein